MKGRLPDPRFWKGRRVLLTGHTGFKGAWTTLWLHQMGAAVTGIALAPETKPNLFDLAHVETACRSNIADIRDAVALRAIVEELKPEVVLHMAAQALVRRSYREPEATFAINVMGTANVLESLRDSDGLKACLVVTSDKVYENDGTGWPFNEDDKLGGHDPYSASKAAAEIVTASYRKSFFVNTARVATARGGNVIGGGDFSEDRIVPDIWRAHNEGAPLVLRYPDATRPWQHVLDCLSGYLVFAERMAMGEVDVPALNFGPHDLTAVSVREVVGVMQEAIGACAGWIQAEGPLPKEMPVLGLCSDKAEGTLGWRSRLPAQAAAELTAAWYKALTAGADMREVTLAQIKQYA